MQSSRRRWKRLRDPHSNIGSPPVQSDPLNSDVRSRNPRILRLHCNYTVVMEELYFAWDSKKGRSNELKHGGSVRKARIRAEPTMKKHYDFSQSKSNPYVRTEKRQITIRLDASTIDYFKDLSKRSGIPYQNLINLYLRDCAAEKKRLKLEWAA